MTLKQFTTNGDKIIVNMDAIKYVEEDSEDGYVILRFENCGVRVKCTLKSIMRWYQKQNQAKKAKTVEIPQATFTPFYYKDGQTPIDRTPTITC